MPGSVHHHRNSVRPPRSPAERRCARASHRRTSRCEPRRTRRAGSQGEAVDQRPPLGCVGQPDRSADCQQLGGRHPPGEAQQSTGRGPDDDGLAAGRQRGGRVPIGALDAAGGEVRQRGQAGIDIGRRLAQRDECPVSGLCAHLRGHGAVQQLVGPGGGTGRHQAVGREDVFVERNLAGRGVGDLQRVRELDQLTILDVERANLGIQPPPRSTAMVVSDRSSRGRDQVSIGELATERVRTRVRRRGRWRNVCSEIHGSVGLPLANRV